ncbi:MAG: ABC transporter ATP-binding protein [Candidatus Heimdallarchaeaceae archaeon]|jgi:ABC-2 type transport system ATP-binding protein
MSESKEKDISNSEMIPDTDNSNSIEVKDLEKHFTGNRKLDDVKAVDGVTFQVKNGELFGLLGPNGAGKTTIINILAGLCRPTGGTAFVGGYNVKTELKKVKEKISVCPQDPAVHKFLSGMGNIKFFGKLYLMSKQQIMERAEELLKLLGLYDARKRLAKGYSGGMLRQLSLIISLINDPAILFLDEPTVGMDPRNRRRVWEFLDTIKKQNKTIILTTHYIEEAEALCDRVAIIDYGKLIAIGPPKELIKEHGAEDLEGVFMKITGRRILEGM